MERIALTLETYTLAPGKSLKCNEPWDRTSKTTTTVQVPDNSKLAHIKACREALGIKAGEGWRRSKAMGDCGEVCWVKDGVYRVAWFDGVVSVAA